MDGSGAGGRGGATVLGKFSLIDLAGSERGVDHESTDKQTQMEGRQINQSLLALKEVIRAKELGRHHAPFRQSRLTQVLEESLTGKRCHTTVIGCVSPAQRDTQQTVNTLRYAESLSPSTAHGRHRRSPFPSASDVVADNKGAAAEAAAAEAAAELLANAASHKTVVSREMNVRSSVDLFAMELGAAFEGGSARGSTELLLDTPTPPAARDGNPPRGFF